jgi:hypothetical protein
VAKTLTLLAGLIGIAVLAYTFSQEVWDAEKLAPYYPTPHRVAEKMLELGELKPGELLYDLGSGDGRIVVLAAQQFQARAVGFEIDLHLVHQSRSRIAESGLQDQARIEKQDLMSADFSQPDLVTVYLLPGANEKIRPLLETQMRPGSRVVSHDFVFDGWTLDKTVTLWDETEWVKGEHRIYLYRR